MLLGLDAASKPHSAPNEILKMLRTGQKDYNNFYASVAKESQRSLVLIPIAFITLFLQQNFHATPVSKDMWQSSILKSETPVLVEFYASWCGPCRMVHRVIDEIATEYAGKLKCFVLNTDKDLQIAEDYEIKAVPVVLLFKNGQKCDTVIGTMPKEFYVNAIERVLKS